jgi:protein tyrosine/serine phosphatase
VRWGALVRADHPNKLSAAGWTALYAHGIRTIISLETDGIEDESVVLPQDYNGLMVVPAAIEDLSDKQFLEVWAKSGLWSTPLYYRDAIARWPARHAAVFLAIARAQAGGVLFHCARGVDRTGIIGLMLLSLLGVPRDQIAEDYLLSVDPERDLLLQEQGTTAREVILNTLKELDMPAYLLGAGVSPAEIDTLKERLLE